MRICDIDGKTLIESACPTNVDSINLSRAMMKDGIFEGFFFDDSIMENSIFDGADLYGCRFFRTILRGSSMKNVDLRGSILALSNLVGVDLRGANLGPNRMRGPTNLCAANLTGANLDGADLSGCKYDEKTLFPAGFSPMKHGMVLIQGISRD